MRIVEASCLAIGLSASMALAADVARDDAPPPPQRVLFLGNSLTYVNDVPTLVQAFAREADVLLDVTTHAEPDWSLQEHARSRRSRTLLAQRWDIVVLQQGATTQSKDGAMLATWSARLAHRARVSGTPRIVLYAPTPALSRMAHVDVGSANHAAAAHAIDACVLPVMFAAKLVFDAQPDAVLHRRDGLHANVAGSLLAAAVIAQGLFGPQAHAPADIASLGTLDPAIGRWLDATAARALADAPGACRPPAPE